MRRLRAGLLVLLALPAVGAAAGAAAEAAAEAAAGAAGEAAAWAAVAAAAGAAPAGRDAVLVDGFDDAALWRPFPADGVELNLTGDAGEDGGALRLDFRFTGGGYAIARRELDLALPDNYALAFRLRGEAPVEHLELKLIDASGENVWWHVWRDVDFPRQWQTFTAKKRQISFAWGPAGGGEIRRVAAIEFAITAGSGGRGTVWLDRLELRPLPPPDAAPPAPVASASSARRGQPASAVLDGEPATAWAPRPGDGAPWLALDLGGPREFGGLVLDWAAGRHAVDYDVEAADEAGGAAETGGGPAGDGRGGATRGAGGRGGASPGGGPWRLLASVRGGNGGRDRLFLPESEARRLRVRVLAAAGGEGAALAEIRVEPLAFGASREAFFGAIAREARRGLYPRGIAGEQPFWTIVGADADDVEGLLGEDGALETGPGRFSVEPFLFADGKLITWADVSTGQSLEGGGLPIPTATWRAGALRLDVTAFTVGEPGAAAIVARYRVANTGAAPATPTLFLAVRPFQVNPPAQFLNLRGGCAPIRELALDGAVVRVDGAPAVLCLTPPAVAGATTFAGGDAVADFLSAGLVPPDSAVVDEFGAASAALAWPLALEPGAVEEVALAVPLHGVPPAAPAPVDAGAARLWMAGQLRQCGNDWRRRLGSLELALPRSGAWLEESIRAQIGWILVTRAGPAFQPGVRSYARSWIRDGALTASALQRAGLPGPARAFAEWFAPHQYANGKVPCVVDRRGADPVPEHDSSGQFIFMIAEDYRYTHDREFAAHMWPRVRAAAAYLDSLRRERLGEEWRAPDKIEFHGLLPPSISHEGYSAKPMHSYWDDFFAYRGFRDAAWLAGELGLPAERARWDAVAAEFGRDVAASVAAAMARHGVPYVPGCADLGDFDATSTAIAFDPTGAAALLPPAALAATFEQYWANFRERRVSTTWDAYTPYEMRTIGAFLRLGWRDRAGELLAWFLADQKPPGWRQWPEVVTREPREPRFLGDLPHTWVGSDFLRSALDLFAYVDEASQSLVLAAGVPRAWIDEEPGVSVKGLRTPYGTLGYTLRRDGEGRSVAQIAGGLTVPPGGLVLRGPWAGEVRAARVDGREVAPGAEGAIVVRATPAVVEIETLRP